MDMCFLKPPIADSVGTELTNKHYNGLYINKNLTDRLANIMSSVSHNNAVITGKAGVGKTTLAQALAESITNGEFPRLNNKRIFSINIDVLLRECYTSASIGERFKNLFEEARCFNLILFIDEGHRLCNSNDPSSVGNIVKPYLTDDDIRVILATTQIEYERFIAADHALKRRFEEVYIEEPNEQTTAKILSKICLSRYPNYVFQKDVIESIIGIAERYSKQRSNPDRSLSVLDYAAAWAANQGHESGSISKEDIYRAQAEKLGLSLDSISIDYRDRVNLLSNKLLRTFSAWTDAAKELASAFKPILTRKTRKEGPLCAVKIEGCDSRLIRDAAITCASELGFTRKEEIIEVKSEHDGEQLVRRVLRNPHCAIIVATSDDNNHISFLDDMTLHGKIMLKDGDNVDLSDAIIFQIDTTSGNNKTIGFSDITDKIPNNAAVISSIRFGHPEKERLSEIYERFLSFLDADAKALGVKAEILIVEESRQTLMKRFDSELAWTETEDAAEEILSSILSSELPIYNNDTCIQIRYLLSRWVPEIVTLEVELSDI